MTGPITLPFVTTYDGKGAKQADISLKGLMKTQIAGTVTLGVLTQQIGKALNAYSEDERQQKQLALAVQNSTGASQNQVLALEDVVQKLQFQKAVVDDELRPALGFLVRATGDVTEAQNLLGLALDISAATGKNLESVSVALSKAALGQFTALKRLGIGLDADAVKAKDFAAVTRELSYTFKGAADAAANSASGGFKKFRIAVDEIYETVGAKVAPQLANYAVVLSKVTEAALSSETKSNGFTKALGSLAEKVTSAGQLIRGIKTLNSVVNKFAGESTKATDTTRNLSRQFRAFEGTMMSAYRNGLKPTKDELKLLANAQEEARQAAKDHADTLRDRMEAALQTVGENVKRAQADFDNFAGSLNDQIRGFVSLGDAVRTQTDAQDELNDSLKARRDAYAALQRIDPTSDAEGYASALLDVAAAEKQVSAAQTKRAQADYSKVFAQQIADAQAFSTDLQTLISRGLQQDGLAQLINLGPVAGRQVAQDLINGTNGMSVGGLNQQLAGLRTSGEALGASGANAFFGAALTSAQGLQGQVNNYSIKVEAGLVSNPEKVGRDIIEAILAAERISGQVFLTI